MAKSQLQVKALSEQSEEKGRFHQTKVLAHANSWTRPKGNVGKGLHLPGTAWQKSIWIETIRIFPMKLMAMQDPRGYRHK